MREKMLLTNKKRLFFVMACGQCQGGECFNESKSSIIDDIDGYNDRNTFDAFVSFWEIKREF